MAIIPMMSGFCYSWRYAFLAVSIFLIVLSVFLYLVSTYRKDGSKPMMRGAALASLCMGAIAMTAFAFCL